MDPTLAISIAQSALTLVGLFGSHSRGVPDLLSAQMDAINAISQQIVKLDQKLNEIYNDIEELLQLTRELPDKTVLALHKSLIEDAFVRYAELLGAYKSDLAKYGTAAAQKNAGDQFEKDVLERIRLGRDGLMRYRYEFTIPTLAKALQIEVQTMIIMHYSPSLITAAVKSYLAWFSAWNADADKKSLPNKLKDLADQHSALPDQIRNTRWMCLKDFSTDGIVATSCTQVFYDLDTSFDQQQLNEVDEAAQMKAAGAPIPAYFEKLVIGQLHRRDAPVPGMPMSVQDLPNHLDRGAIKVHPDNDMYRAESDQVAKDAYAKFCAQIELARTELITESSMTWIAANSALSCSEFLKSPVLN